MKSDKNPHAVALGKLGGQQRTKAKIDAARENGKKGGRPKTIKNATVIIQKQKKAVG